jgi:hypothetical protein
VLVKQNHANREVEAEDDELAELYSPAIEEERLTDRQDCEGCVCHVRHDADWLAVQSGS